MSVTFIGIGKSGVYGRLAETSVPHAGFDSVSAPSARRRIAGRSWSTTFVVLDDPKQEKDQRRSDHGELDRRRSSDVDAERARPRSSDKIAAFHFDSQLGRTTAVELRAQPLGPELKSGV